MAGPAELISINPADGSVVWRGQATTEGEIERLLAVARNSFLSWSEQTIEARAGFLESFAEVVRRRKEELARLIALEVGKPLWESRLEVDAIAGKAGISIEAQNKRCSAFSAGAATTRFRPHGVLAVLGPYNFPGHLPNGHICPALLAGNCVIFKPSEHAPATAEALMDCWRATGLPEGVLQLCQGGVATARSLVSALGLDGVLFTGSASTGKALARQFAETPGRILALEMGGNNPLIVDLPHLEEIETAAAVAAYSAFVSAGQRCTCARRLILVDHAATETFMESLIRQAQDLTIGDPLADPSPFMGPLAHPAFVDPVLAAQERLIGLGARSLLTGRAIRPGTGFISPGILDVTGVAGIPDEEIFGPLLQVSRAPDLDAAIACANATRYGLAAGLLSDDGARYAWAQPRLRAGIINWNVPLPGASSAAPFGGIGDSGNLRPSAFLATDYCNYPVASMEATRCRKPPLPG